MSTRRRRPHGDDGAVTIWVLGCVALLLSVALITTVRSSALLARHRAESAADLAALAGAGQIGVDPTQICAAARVVASANLAMLRSCLPRLDASARSGSVRVQVRMSVDLPIVGAESVTASARAGRLAVPP